MLAQLSEQRVELIGMSNEHRWLDVSHSVSQRENGRYYQRVQGESQAALRDNCVPRGQYCC
jgi:hypothetical protein